ncbi:MAG: phosphopantothenate--cysteine ligase [Clostridiales Family XIII bacterium]|nr:phosphopantothenate--cysteine ligase [Clostridiales Family XIII bacterium]
MNIMITAGGTTESIDNVRSITNTGTGRLGAVIAEQFAGQDAVDRIFYICNARAVRPTANKIEQHIAEDTKQLEQTIQTLCQFEKIDAVIHSMAVSDYRVRNITTASAIAEDIAETLSQKHSCSIEQMTECIYNSATFRKEDKISSNVEDLVILLEKTPKVIAQLRPLLPDAVIVGFKLLSGVDEETLIDTAFELLRKNDCDYVLANDMHTVSGYANHIGYLVDRNKHYGIQIGKEEIAKFIVRTVLNHEGGL